MDKLLLSLFLAIAFTGLFVIWFAAGMTYFYNKPPEVTLPAIRAVPQCDRLGPYPYTDSLDMYVLVCPKGEV